MDQKISDGRIRIPKQVHGFEYRKNRERVEDKMSQIRMYFSNIYACVPANET